MLCLISPCSYSASSTTPATAKIAIIIDDLGDHKRSGYRAIELPGSITYAFLPHTPHAVELANKAYKLGKEVMLHLPMQSMDTKALGPGGLTLNMNKDDVIQTVRDGISAIPHIKGINNHMGSLLTRHPGHMQWLMEAIKQRNGLFFIDSRTTHHTVAEQIARENRIPVRSRDVFLDDDPSPAAIAYQFQRLIKKAKQNGTAVGIGHPYDSTLDLLEQALPLLKEEGIQLVLASELFQPKPAPKQRMTMTPEEKNHLVYLAAPHQPKTTPTE